MNLIEMMEIIVRKLKTSLLYEGKRWLWDGCFGGKSFSSAKEAIEYAAMAACIEPISTTDFTGTRGISLYLGSSECETVIEAEFTVSSQFDYTNDGDYVMSHTVSKITLTESGIQLPLASFDEDTLDEIANEIAEYEKERGEEVRTERALDNRNDKRGML